MNVQERLARWQSLKAEAERTEARMRTIAWALERRPAALADLDSDYARLVGVDEDGRVRFSVRGLGEQTFSVEELEA